jgi:hypothetical protein
MSALTKTISQDNGAAGPLPFAALSPPGQKTSGSGMEAQLVALLAAKYKMTVQEEDDDDL